ncbi:MAG: NADP-dependent phosphogluconate dehydrogenase [Chitinophagaceae bacterium]|nr:MAG: NADP-dependent phosphogluconate dehydrogenase [Chitinophagaceae bacterium]
MEGTYDFGMIGIGVMGSNLLLNIADNGFAVIGFDLKQERADKLEAAAPKGTRVKGTTDIAFMAKSLKKPRKIMMLVPAGKPVDDVINNLLPHLEDGDIVIDGGNSFYKDTQRRFEELQPKGIHFFGMGVSGGEAGARFGPSMMPGGDKDAYQYLQPILEGVAAKVDGKPCVAYMGNGPAGHYVKMVHNGIEYAMMQLISEAYDIMKRGCGYSNEDLHIIFSKWNKEGLQSFLIEITAEVFRTLDTETESKTDYLVDHILDKAGSKGTGKWTSQDAMNIPVSIPTIDMAVAMRDLSVYKDQRVAASKLYGNRIQKINLPSNELIAELEDALLFGFTMAYAQGLSLLAKASEEYGFQIQLADVVSIWKGGCIIRSSLLYQFDKAFASKEVLPNVLLDETIADLLQQKEEAARNILNTAVQARIPVAALGSAVSYFDAYCSERLPTNLIQAQRDFFGAHTYQRIDREGVFHTEWNVDSNAQA